MLKYIFDKQSQNKTKASVLFALTSPYRRVKINILTVSLAQKLNRCKRYYTKDIKTRIYNIQARASSFSERQPFALFGCRERMCGCASFFIFTFSTKANATQTARRSSVRGEILRTEKLKFSSKKKPESGNSKATAWKTPRSPFPKK